MRAKGARGWQSPGLFSMQCAHEPVAQSVEHVTFNHGVLGSSPSRLTNKIKDLARKWVLNDGSGKQQVSRKPAGAFWGLAMPLGPTGPENAWARRAAAKRGAGAFTLGSFEPR